MPQLRVLIVDDEPVLLEMMQIGLEDYRFQVDTAGSGFEALAGIVQPVLPDAMIVGDLRPVPYTSLGLINDIRVAFTRRQLPIIQVSTQTERIDKLCGLAYGADRYMTKPFSIPQVVRALHELLLDRTIK